MLISLTSLGSSQIFLLPHFSTDDARRFCRSRETPMTDLRANFLKIPWVRPHKTRSSDREGVYSLLVGRHGRLSARGLDEGAWPRRATAVARRARPSVASAAEDHALVAAWLDRTHVRRCVCSSCEASWRERPSRRFAAAHAMAHRRRPCSRAARRARAERKAQRWEILTHKLRAGPACPQGIFLIYSHSTQNFWFAELGASYF